MLDTLEVHIKKISQRFSSNIYTPSEYRKTYTNIQNKKQKCRNSKQRNHFFQLYPFKWLLPLPRSR